MIWAGLTLGFLGSLHCVGMCGPIAVAAFRSRKAFWTRFWYNIGRTLTYMSMGLAMGLAGSMVRISGFQQLISIILGGLIFLMAILYIAGLGRNISSLASIGTGLRNKISKFIKGGNTLLLGIANGFLPCGLVYLALAGALVAPSVGDTVLYMAAFGLGTIPAMWGISYVAPGLSRVLNLNVIVPYMFAVVGLLLVLRGMGLGIPYLSPDLGADSALHQRHM